MGRRRLFDFVARNGVFRVMLRMADTRLRDVGV